MHDIGPGDVLDQRFQITDVIQKSGMSTIYKANLFMTFSGKFSGDSGFYSPNDCS
jgi:hypothetical protein